MRTKYIVLFFIIALMLPYVVAAESGYLNITSQVPHVNSYQAGGGNPAATFNFQKFMFDVTDYQRIGRFNVSGSGGNTFTGFGKPFDTTTFTCTVGGTCTGIVYYNATSKTIYWDFDAFNLITATKFELSYANTSFFTGISMTGTEKQNAVPSSTLPVCLKDNVADVCIAGNNLDAGFVVYGDIVQTESNLQYDVSYNGSLFTINVNKDSIATKTRIKNYFGALYNAEGTFNSLDYIFTATYNQGIVFNGSLAGGASAEVIINTTDAISQPPVPGSGGSASGQIYFDLSNSTAGNLYGVNASLDDANFTAFTTYYIETVDPDGVVVTGFPVQFNTQTYSSGRLWNFAKAGTYNATLKYCNMFDLTCSNVLQTGLHNLDSATVLVTLGTFNYTVTTNQANYQPNNTIIITVNNPSQSNVYVTAYGKTGIITEVAWNTVAPANQVTTLTKVLPSYLPFGEYTVNLATTTSYSPVVAQAKFNITTASNTSNTLSIMWDESIYLVGKTGIVRSTSNYNTSTMTITSPTGVTSSFTFPANSTNVTGITLNAVGIWQARIVDDGNSSNFSTALTEATAGNPTENETIELCKAAASYVCWDKSQYNQGEAYVLSFRLTPKVTDIASLDPYLEITNPNGIVEYNQSVNISFDVNQNKFVGTLSGSFSPQAIVGVYFARIKNQNVLGVIEIRAESATNVLASATGVTSTEGQVSTTTATNLLNVLGMVAFYGLLLYVGLLFGMLKLMSSAGFSDSGMFIYAAVILANLVALVGLFDPFKMYVLVLTWIIAGANFYVGRKVVTGG